MKGYQNGNILWIFDEPAEIPSVAAGTTVIYVQQEWMEEFKEENEEYATLIQPYNYKLLTVNKTVWADHTDDNLGWDVTLTGTQTLTQHLALNKNTALEGESITVTPDNTIYGAQFVSMTTSPSTNIEWDNTNGKWGFTMLDSDVEATATERTLYHISTSGEYTSDFNVQPYAYMPEHQYQYDSYVNLVPSDALISPDNGYTMTVMTDAADPQSVSTSWDSTNSYWYFGMPASDVVATMTYEAPVQTYMFTVKEANTLTPDYQHEYEEGDSVTYDFGTPFVDELGLYHWEFNVDPIDLSYTFDTGRIGYIDDTDPENPVDVPAVNATLSFTMPASTVLFEYEQVTEEQEPAPESEPETDPEQGA